MIGEHLVKRRLVAMLFAGALVLSACGGEAQTASPDGTTESSQPSDGPGAGRTDLIAAIASPLETVDPRLSLSQLSGGVLLHVFETLTVVSADATVGPKLATSWSADEDGRTWTFELRDDVVFHDGTPFNAEAVKLNFEDPNANQGRRVGGIPVFTEVTVVDEYTVQFVTEEVVSGLPIAFGVDIAAIVSPASISEWGAELGQNNAAGTGPFRIESFSLPDQLVVERNDDYWGEPASLEQITFNMASEAETRMGMLLSGEADLNIYAGPDDVARIEAEEGYEMVQAPSIRLFMAHLPMQDDEMQDLGVRQALNMAIDRNQIVETLYGGAAAAANSSIGPNIIGFEPFEEIPYDPEEANRLLEEAGWELGEDNVRIKDGEPFPTLTLTSPRGRYPKDAQLAETVQGYLSEIGIPAELQVDEFATFYEQSQELAGEPRRMTLMAWGFGARDGRDPLCLIYPAGGVRNFGGYDNPDLADLCAEIDATSDFDTRSALITEGSELVYEDLPAIFLVVPDYLAAQKTGLEGVVIHPGEYHDLTQAVWTGE